MSVFKHSLCFLTVVMYLKNQIFPIPRKTLIEIHCAQDCMTINDKSCQLPHTLQESYRKLVQIEKDFSHYGHKVCSAEILLQCANIHR